jgi:hypothetical protein
VIASLDSRLSLASVVATTADRLGFDVEETEALREETIEVIRELLELGALHFRGD